MGDLLFSAERVISLLGNLSLECERCVILQAVHLYGNITYAFGHGVTQHYQTGPGEAGLQRARTHLWYLCVPSESPDSQTQLEMLVLSNFASAHLGWGALVYPEVHSGIAQELLDASALSFQGLGKHRPKALNLLLDFLAKSSRFQRHLHLPAWQVFPCSIITRLQTNALFPQNTVDNGKALREGTRRTWQRRAKPTGDFLLCSGKFPGLSPK